MRVKVLQVVFHNKEPVFSVDFHPSGVFATAGTDGEVKVSASAQPCGPCRTKRSRVIAKPQAPEN